MVDPTKAFEAENGFQVSGQSGIFSGDIDPSVSGLDAPVGSLFMRTSSSQLWRKVDTGTTDWIRQAALLYWGAYNLTRSAESKVIPPGFSDFPNYGTATFGITVDRSGVIERLNVRHNFAPGTGPVVEYYVRKNGVNTSLMVSLASDTIGSQQDDTHQVSVVAGDVIGLLAVKPSDLGGGANGGKVGMCATVGFF
jgi:hypothetical protein